MTSLYGKSAWGEGFYSVGPNGSLALTARPDILNATGTVLSAVSGSLVLTQAAQTASAAGTVAVSGALVLTQAAQTIAAAGGPILRGALTATQGDQTLSSAGTVLTGTVADLNITQAAQTIAAAGSITGIAGSLHVTQAAQTISATGALTIVGTLTVAQAPQTLSADGLVVPVVTGALTVTQAEQALSAAGCGHSGRQRLACSDAGRSCSVGGGPGQICNNWNPRSCAGRSGLRVQRADPWLGSVCSLSAAGLGSLCALSAIAVDAYPAVELGAARLRRRLGHGLVRRRGLSAFQHVAVASSRPG